MAQFGGPNWVFPLSTSCATCSTLWPSARARCSMRTTASLMVQSAWAATIPLAWWNLMLNLPLPRGPDRTGTGVALFEIPVVAQFEVDG